MHYYWDVCVWWNGFMLRLTSSQSFPIFFLISITITSLRTSLAFLGAFCLAGKIVFWFDYFRTTWVVLPHEFKVYTLRNMAWLLAREIMQINSIQLCSPIINTFLSDYNFLTWIQPFLSSSYKCILAPIFAWTYWFFIWVFHFTVLLTVSLLLSLVNLTASVLTLEIWI